MEDILITNTTDINKVKLQITTIGNNVEFPEQIDYNKYLL